MILACLTCLKKISHIFLVYFSVSRAKIENATSINLVTRDTIVKHLLLEKKIDMSTNIIILDGETGEDPMQVF